MRRWTLVLLAASVLVAGPMAVSAHIPAVGSDSANHELPTLAPLLEGVTDAVVNLSATFDDTELDNPLSRDPRFRRFFGNPNQVPRASAGSGVIVDAAKGHILTNNHVVEKAAEIVVTLTDGRKFDAEVLGTDPGTDLAVLRIEADGLTEIAFGDSDAIRVGDFVLAIGNPFGLGQTVTSGIVSALGRSGINPSGYEQFIQTDASINPGNSGGALVTLDGKLIGINSAILSTAGGNIGIGFAVPTSMVRVVMDQLIEFGRVRRARLGVMIRDLTPELAEALDLEVTEGAVIQEVASDTAAEDAGLLAGDVIAEVDGEPVRDANDLRNRIGMMRAGTEVELRVIRLDGEAEVAVTLGEVTEEEEAVEANSDVSALAGAVLGDLAGGMPGFGEVEGVAVLSIAAGSAAERNGLQAQDVITAVNNREVTSLEDFHLRTQSAPGVIALTLWRHGTKIFLVLPS